MRLQTKIVLLIIMVGFASTAIITYLNVRLLQAAMEKGLEEKGDVLARTISELTSRGVIDGDVGWVREALRRAVAQNPGVEYAIITDFDDRLFCHTFDNGLPSKIHTAHEPSTQDHASHQRFSINGVPVLDVQYPLIRGMRAHIHLGLNESDMVAQSRALVQRSLLIALAVCGLGLLVAMLISRRVVGPIGSFIGQLEELSHAGPETATEIVIPHAGKEITELADSLNRMLADRFRTEEALRESEERFRELAANIREVFWLGAPDWQKVFYVSPAYEKIWQRTCATLYEQPQSWLEPLPEQDRQQVLAFIEKISNQDFSEALLPSFRLERSDGTVRWVAARAYPIRDAAGKIIRVAGVAKDITERKRIEDALRESEAAHRKAQEIAHIGHWDLDLTTNRLSWSDEVYRIFEKEQPAPLSYETFLELVHPDDRKLVNAAYTDSLRNRTEYDIVHRLLFDDGRVKFVQERGFTDYDVEGKPLRSHGTVQDITPLKKAQVEKEELMQKLLQAQKMEAIGTLAGGIAHDFNNILMAILGYAEIVADELPEGSAVRKDQQQVIAAANRAKALVQQILTFSRQSVHELVPLSIPPVIKEALKLLRSSIPATIEIRQDIDPDCGAILADPTQIHQIIMNLCTNAYHAMRDAGGILGVTLKTVEISPDDYPYNPELKPGKYLQLEVSDTGHGMDKETLAKIFEPYFTSKEMGEGTGLGLAVVHGIVKSLAGHITVYSEPGQGTSFHVYLPLPVMAADPMAEAEIAPAVPRGNGEHLLVVDDEEVLVRFEQKALEYFGYRVTSCTSSPAALAAFERQPHGFDLVITDMTMPEMTGAELAGKILRIRPDTPVILCTGFSEIINEEQAKRLGIQEFIMKPVIPKDLAAAVRRALDKGKGAAGS